MKKFTCNLTFYFSRLVIILIVFLPIQLLAQKKITVTSVNRANFRSLSNVFRNYSLYKINTPDLAQHARQNKKGTINFELDFSQLPAMNISLQENDILTSDYKLVVGNQQSKQEFAKPESMTYKGKLADDDNSSIFLTITDGIIFGSIKGKGKEYFIEPLKYFNKQAPAGTFVLYEAKDVVPQSGITCGVTEAQQRSVQLSQQFNTDLNLSVSGTCKMVEVAIASDDGMFSRYGSVAAVQERNIGIMNLMVGIYQNAQIGSQYLEFKISGQFVATNFLSNPYFPNYSGNDAQILLADFAHWGQFGGLGTFPFVYDLAQLWTTRDIAVSGNTGVVGLAYVGSTCTPNKYQVLEDISLSVLAKAVLAAHETGHNLGAMHDNQFDPYIMAPSLSDPPYTTFSATSLDAMNNYILSGGGSCFSPCNQTIVAQFSASPNAVCLGSNIIFTDYSVGQVTSRTWDFGDGTPSSSVNQSQSVHYSTTGIKTASLNVSNGTLSSSVSKNFLVSNSPAGASPVFVPGSTDYDALYSFTLANISYSTNVVYVFSSKYDNRACTDITALNPGATYIAKAGIGTQQLFPDISSPTNLQILIDYNNDGDFSDANENVFFSSDCVQAEFPLTITFPQTVPLANTFLRMRVIGLPCIAEPTDGVHLPTYAQVLDFSVYFTDLTCLKTYYEDHDHDGYGNPLVSVQSCTPVVGYVLNNQDCDDTDNSVHPGATEVCDGKDNNCNGLIDEGVKQTFYQDFDGDGYGNAAISVQACSAPEGYVSNSTDCNDHDNTIYPGAPELCDGKDNNCNGVIDEGVKQTFYQDLDGDGYGNPSVFVMACAAPAGYVLPDGDCDDSDPTVNPGAVEVCGNGKDDNCNGVIDEVGCYQCQNATAFSTTNITSTTATFNWVSIPNPAEWELQYKSTANGSKWIDVIITGNKRSYTATGLLPNQNYNWHIRAKCGKNYTVYSVAIPFTTQGAITFAGKAKTIPGNETEIAGEKLSILAMPNPSSNSFRIDIGNNNLKEPVQLVITDIMGRIVEKRMTTAGQTITIGDNFKNGTYIIRAIQGNLTKELKLVRL